ncbi:universal stress protein [uncultured Psychroserpens sp.]|uniref:universal stress protein n=1 Tax=uncultured Psychroserpens sp. TaxID=255436 RepID=UPI00262C8D17|nr:universal stress protein [uncultured Psychroserpens sp.]
MKKILLPTDFSDNSLNAIRYAMAFYQNEPCKFYVLNIQKVSSFVSDDLMAMQPSETIFHSLIDSAKTKVKTLIRTLKEDYQNTLHEFEAKVDYDNFIDGINQLIDLEQIDMIVMGTRGASTMSKKLFGSHTVRVIQRCSCPVLAIPNNYTYSKISDIAFPSNYYTAYNSEDLVPLINLVELNNYNVHVIHVKNSEHLTEYQENNRAYLDSCFSKVNHSFVELEEDKLFKVITNYINNNDIGLLTMMSRKHSFLERLFVTHPTESFAFNLKVPLLVMENTGSFYIK